jgi:MarR family transcriptional regulator for hemolysin
MVSMLDRLERDGFVTRAPSATDRRVKLVQLTDTGKTLYAEVINEAAPFRADLLAGLDRHALAAATVLLETLKKRLEDGL